MKAILPILFSCTLFLQAGELPEIHGFLDTRLGLRLQDDPNQDDLSLAETRAQIELNYLGSLLEFQFRADGVYDDLVDSHTIDLEEGRGWLDIREAWMLFSPTGSMDVKVGRQILTWGTGDLLFINDLFPKDWQSFFSGRDVEYLKAPSDAVFISYFPSFGSIDMVYMPRFDSDRHIRGERFSFFNPAYGTLTGRNAIIDPIRPEEAFEDDAFSLRISGNAGGLEWALYGYQGFHNSPGGFDPIQGRPLFNELRSLGGSIRGSLGKGLVNAEVGVYQSRDDQPGNNPFVPNSEFRALIGYERELANELTGAFQIYLEHMQDYGAYQQTLPPGMPEKDEDRIVLSARFTKMAMNQNLTLSWFTYLSPTDDDGYTRPNVKYKLTDKWLLTGGANIFWGSDNHTFFGQFEDGNNLYAGARWSF